MVYVILVVLARLDDLSEHKMKYREFSVGNTQRISVYTYNYCGSFYSGSMKVFPKLHWTM